MKKSKPRPIPNRWQKGESGNPKGRPKGSKNRFPLSVREFCREIVEDEEYRINLIRCARARILPPALEIIILQYGIMQQDFKQSESEELHYLTDEELRERVKEMAESCGFVVTQPGPRLLSPVIEMEVTVEEEKEKEEPETKKEEAKAEKAVTFEEFFNSGKPKSDS